MRKISNKQYIVESVLISSLRRNDIVLVQLRGSEHFKLKILEKSPYLLYKRNWVANVEWPHKHIGQFILGEKGAHILKIIENEENRCK